MTDREIDALIAEKLFGWIDVGWSEIRKDYRGRPPEVNMWKDVPLYTTDPAACAQVKAVARQRWAVLAMSDRPAPAGNRLILFSVFDTVDDWYNADPRAYCQADTEERAVCLAALRALGQDV